LGPNNLQALRKAEFREIVRLFRSGAKLPAGATLQTEMAVNLLRNMEEAELQACQDTDRNCAEAVNTMAKSRSELATKVEDMKKEVGDLQEKLSSRPRVEAKAQVANEELEASNERVREAQDREDDALQNLKIEEREKSHLDGQQRECEHEVQAQEELVRRTQLSITESSNSMQKLSQSLHVLSQLLDTVGQGESMDNTALPSKAKIMLEDGSTVSGLQKCSN
jgi:chromosome segregation ATPase